MSIKKRTLIIASLALVTGCSDRAPVVIPPGLFTEDWPTVLDNELVKNDKCIVDDINGIHAPQGELVFKSGEALNMSGWAFDPKRGASEIYVQLVSAGLTYNALAERTVRADINQLFKLDAAWTTGFSLRATQNIEPNEYQLRILQPFEGSVSQCKPPITLKIKPASGT